jgi:hypothetical protein
MALELSFRTRNTGDHGIGRATYAASADLGCGYIVFSICHWSLSLIHSSSQISWTTRGRDDEILLSQGIMEWPGARVAMRCSQAIW